MDGLVPMDPITQRIVELRESDKAKPMAFSAIAAAINADPAFPDLELTKDRAQKIYQRVTRAKGGLRRRVVAVGDIHSNPDDALIQAIIDEEPDKVVFGGDVFDLYQFSRHPRHLDEKPRSYKEEAAVNENMMRRVHDTGTDLIIMTGNHDAWYFAMVAERMGFVDDDVAELFPNPLDLLARKFERCTLVRQQTSYNYPDGTQEAMAVTRYTYLMGDALLSHANFTSKNPGGAALKLYAWTQNWRRPLGWPDLSLMVQFHGHKISYAEMEGGHCILVEPGMGGSPAGEGYKIGYDSKWTPGALGAVVFDQDYIGNEWKTDRASVELIRPRR